MNKKLQRKMLLIGGGEIREKQTLPIDLELIRMTGIATPNILFIPTASNDSDGYIQSITDYFGNELSCQVKSLKLLSTDDSYQKIQEKVSWADAIYVGGGNTAFMMQTWKNAGLVEILHNAWNKGTVLSGLSAGANCWCDFNHSDSQKIDNPKADFILLKGLGFFRQIICPHLNDEGREQSFKEILLKEQKNGIGIENLAALKITGDTYSVITANESAKVKLFHWIDGRLETQVLFSNQSGYFKDLFLPN